MWDDTGRGQVLASALLLLGALLLTGCVGATEPDEEVAATGTGPAGEAADLPDDLAVERTAEAPADVEVPEPIVVPVNFQGTFEPYGVACLVLPVTGTCTGTPIPSGDFHDGHELDGRLLSIDVVMTWEAASPKTESMYLTSYYRCGDDCSDQDGLFGTSPLALTWEPDEEAPVDRVGIYGMQECQFSPVAWGCAFTPQDFTIQGTITYLPTPVESEVEAPVDLPPPVAVPFTFDGVIPTYAYACELMVTRDCASTPIETSSSFMEPPLGGILLRVDMNVTWDASSPVMDRLLFGGGVSCGEECWDFQWFESMPGTTHIVWEPDIEEEATAFYLGGAKTGHLVGPAIIGASTEQPFHMEGTAIWRPVE